MANELFSAVEDCWLKLSVKITLISDESFANALPRFLREFPTQQLPKIDSGTEVRQQGTSRLLRGVITLGNHMAEGIGMVDKINHFYRLTTNKWFARYEVRYLIPPSDSNSGCV